MDWKLQNEHHNRQDKAQKRDYREDLVSGLEKKSAELRSQSFKRMLARDKIRMEIEKELRSYREKLILMYKEGVFRLAGHDLMFNWTLTEYIRRNQIEDRHWSTFKKHKKAATQDFNDIEGAIRVAPARWGISKEARQEVQFSFHVFSLRCDTVIPSRPTDSEVEARTLSKHNPKQPFV
jgi:hypothetical protein